MVPVFKLKPLGGAGKPWAILPSLMNTKVRVRFLLYLGGTGQRREVIAFSILFSFSFSLSPRGLQALSSPPARA